MVGVVEVSGTELGSDEQVQVCEGGSKEGKSGFDQRINAKQMYGIAAGGSVYTSIAFVYFLCIVYAACLHACPYTSLYTCLHISIAQK